MSDFSDLCGILTGANIPHDVSRNEAGDISVVIEAIDTNVSGYQDFYVQFSFSAEERLVHVVIAE